MKTICPTESAHNDFVATHVTHAHLASGRFEHSVCHGSLRTTYLMLLA